MAGREDQWRELAGRYNLGEPDLSRVASWWHTDGDLGRGIEVVTDMGKSRDAGFTGYRRTWTPSSLSSTATGTTTSFPDRDAARIDGSGVAGPTGSCPNRPQQNLPPRPGFAVT